MSEEKARQIIDLMFRNDEYSRYLGMEILECLPGSCALRMKVRKDMLNGFSVAHGGITFALADSALAFASNSHGRKCLSIDTQINHLKPCVEGDDLRAEAQEVSRGKRTGRYEVKVLNQDEELVAHFSGNVFITDGSWDDELKQ